MKSSLEVKSNVENGITAKAIVKDDKTDLSINSENNVDVPNPLVNVDIEINAKNNYKINKATYKNKYGKETKLSLSDDGKKATGEDVGDKTIDVDVEELEDNSGSYDVNFILYQTNDGENVINKSLEKVYSFNIKMKQDTDIINPEIILNDKSEMDFSKINYCYIKPFDRYYFVKDKTNITNHLWTLQLQCDVLETYKDDILKSYAEYQRPIKDGDYLQVSKEKDLRKEIEHYTSDVDITNEESTVLTTIGSDWE